MACKGHATLAIGAACFSAFLTQDSEAATGAFFNAQAFPHRRYELLVETGFFRANRRDYSDPVFLFPRAVSRVRATELVTALDLRLSLTDNLALQVRLPLRVARAEVRTRGLMVSNQQTLEARERTISSWGVGEALFGAAYRLILARWLTLYTDLGGVIQIDDNPGSSTVVQRLPPATGQAQVFAGGGGHGRFGRLTPGLDYRFVFFAGNSAAYLVRRVGNQSFANGSLARFGRHRAMATVDVAIIDGMSVRGTATWQATLLPLLVEPDGLRRVSEKVWNHEISVSARLRYAINLYHSVELFYCHHLTRSWKTDPFFPIEIPDRGVGIAWHVVGS